MFPGLPDVEICSICSGDSSGKFVTVHHFSQHKEKNKNKNIKNMECKKGEIRERESLLPLLQFTPFSVLNVQGSGAVTSPGASGWAGVLASRVGNPKRRRMEQTADGGGGESFFPALLYDDRACSGSCPVGLSPWPVRPVEGSGTGSDGCTEASLGLLAVQTEGIQAFLSGCWDLRPPGRRGLGRCLLPWPLPLTVR